jgi:hypothetical protein
VRQLPEQALKNPHSYENWTGSVLSVSLKTDKIDQKLIQNSKRRKVYEKSNEILVKHPILPVYRTGCEQNRSRRFWGFQCQKNIWEKSIKIIYIVVVEVIL